MPEPDAQRPGAEVGLLAPVGDVEERARPERVGASPQHRVHQVDPQELLGEVLADQLAVAQHGHAVADLVDLVQEVGDEEDGDAAPLEVVDDPEQLGALVQVEARRRLVQHQHPDVGEDRARDGHQLLYGQRVPAQDRGGVDVEPEVGEHHPRVLPHPGPVDHPEPARLAPEGDVLRNGDVGHQVDLLVDRPDPELLRVVRRPEPHGRPVQPELAGRQRERPRDRLDQRGLAGAVLAHERVHLAGEEPEVDPVERGVRAEVDGAPRELEQRAGLHPPSIPTAGSYLRRSERKTMMRCTPMNSSSMSPTMIRVQDCSAPWNEMIVLMVP